LSEAARPALETNVFSKASVSLPATSGEDCPRSCTISPLAAASASLTTRNFLCSNDVASLACSALNTTVKPRRSPISSCGSTCSDLAASRSSCAMLNETDTLRSEPIEERVPNVEPPRPPVIRPPPPAAPLIDAFDPFDDHDLETRGTLELSKEHCERAGAERKELLWALMPYQRTRLVARRLVLAVPGKGAAVRERGDRKRKHTSETEEERKVRWRHALTQTFGSVFGSTIGNITSYLEGRGIPAERATILRTVRSVLGPAADALRTMHGADVAHLSRGLASCRVVGAQRSTLPELQGPLCPRIDHKYGHVGTAVGATATLLAVYGYMASIEEHAEHLIRNDSLLKAMRCAMIELNDWRGANVDLPRSHEQSLRAEVRALERAVAAATVVSERHQKEIFHPGTRFWGAMVLDQVGVARSAAFPAGRRVDATSQKKLCDDVYDGKIAIRRLLKEHSDAQHALGPPPQSHSMPPPPQPPFSSATTRPIPISSTRVTPLSEIPEGVLSDRSERAGAATSDTNSVTSSWWTNASSSSMFSHVSNDSMGEIVGDLSSMCS